MTDHTPGSYGPCGDISIALSGGGHRASLLALGGLMALVDRGLNERVNAISSVSGGSLTNGVVAAADPGFRDTLPSDFDELALKFCSAIRQKSLYDVRWIVARIIIVSIVPPLIAAYLLVSPLPTLAILLLAPTALMFTGRWLRLAISRAHFPAGTTLSDVRSDRISHHFCATDLVTGMPVTFSSSGAVARRWVPLPPGERGWAIQLHRPHDERLATVVRASAAFPGIAPKVMRLRRYTGGQAIHAAINDPSEYRADVELSRWAFCSDGGIWNNLGTQGLREGGVNRGLPILCINASAPASTFRSWPFWWPGISVVASLVRIMTTLNRNTVEPRVDAVQRELERRHRARIFPDPDDDPLTLIADMRRVSDALATLSLMSGPEQAEGFVGGTRSVIPSSELAIIGNSEAYHIWRESDSDTQINVSTKLSRITPDEAFPLLLRGYVGTWLASVHLKPVVQGDLSADDGRCLIKRLRRISGLMIAV